MAHNMTTDYKRCDMWHMSHYILCVANILCETIMLCVTNILCVTYVTRLSSFVVWIQITNDEICDICDKICDTYDIWTQASHSMMPGFMKFVRHMWQNTWDICITWHIWVLWICHMCHVTYVTKCVIHRQLIWTLQKYVTYVTKYVTYHVFCHVCHVLHRTHSWHCVIPVTLCDISHSVIPIIHKYVTYVTKYVTHMTYEYRYHTVWCLDS